MNGITFNGVHSSQIDGVSGVLAYGFPVSPELENQIVKMKGGHGAIDGGWTYNEMKPTLRILLTGTDITNYFVNQFELKKWLMVKTVKPLIFDALPNKQIMVRALSIGEPERSGSFSFIDVELIAPKPFFEEISLTTHSVNETTSYPYGGISPTDYKLTINPNQSLAFFRVDLTLGDGRTKYILLNKSVVAGDEFVIDTSKRMVTLNGSDVRADLDVKSRYLPIDDFYQFTTNATSPIMNVEYKERW